MKKILLTIVAFCLTAMCLNARTIYLNTSTIDYGANGALLAIWTWGGSSDDTWSVFQNVGENLFSAEIDDDKTGGKIVRFRDIVTTPDWQADIWNQTGDLEIPADKDMITLSQWDNETGGDWSVYTPIVPGPKVYYVVGLKDLKDWSEHEDYKLNEENKLVKSLAAGTYEFKIKEKGTWDNAINAIATSGDCNVACSHTEDDENVTFTIESVQNITIELLENKTICVSTDAVVEPEPEVPGEPRTIYIKGLGSYEATVAMWIWGENLGGKWVTFAAVEGENDIVSAEIGSNYTQCQIIRYAIGDEPSWESNYNRTEDGKDITIPGTEEDKDMLVAGYDGGNYIVGEWQKFTPTPPCNPGTERTIYFNRKNFDTSAYGAVVAAYFFGSCQPDVWKRLAAVEGETVIDSVVITDDYTQFQLVRFANDSELEWTSTIWNRTDKNDNVNIPAENDMFVISVAESTLSGTWETFVRGQEQPIVDPEPTQMRTIYCRMAYDWWYDGDAKVAIRFWKEGEDLGCQWPGQQMTKSESDSKLWSTEIPADAENCLFVRVGYNDDEYNYWGAKTDDQTLVADKDLFTFTTENAAWFSLSEGEHEPKDLCKGVWGVYDANMPTVEIGFAENSEFKVRGFAKLVASGNNIADATLQYYVKLPGNEFFSPITEQYQFLSFGSFTFKVEAIKLGTVVATATKTVNVAAAEWYVAGINGNWNDVYDMFEVAENSWQFTITLSGTHEFKLKHAGSWDGALGISAIDADCSTPGYSGTDNVKIILPSEQEVTFRTDGSTICVSIENGTFGEQEVISVYTIVGSEALIGANWDVENTAADMLEVGENTFALTRTNVTLAAGNYNYKVVGNHQYASWQFPQAGDQTLEIADAGTYNVTFTLILGEEISLTANATKTIVTALESVENIVIFAENGRIFTAENARIYDMLGRDVTRNNGNLHGVYVVKTENVATKIVVR